MKSNSAYTELGTSKSNITLGDIEIKFSVRPTADNAKVKMHDGNGQTKEWNKAKTDLITHEITDAEVGGYVAGLTIAVDEVWTKGDGAANIQNTAALMDYNGTYNFYVNVVGGYLYSSSEDVDTAAELKAKANGGNGEAKLSITVTIAEGTGDKEGKASASVTSGATAYLASVLGDDDVITDEVAAASQEKASFTISLE